MVTSLAQLEKGISVLHFPLARVHMPVTIHLKGIYYAPAIACILILVSCLDCTGYSLLIEDENCVICGPCLKYTILGAVPLICELY